jgi:hypothetical protein
VLTSHLPRYWPQISARRSQATTGWESALSRAATLAPSDPETGLHHAVAQRAYFSERITPTSAADHAPPRVINEVPAAAIPSVGGL